MKTCNACRRIIGKAIHVCPTDVPWIDRFFLRVTKTPTCWLWSGCLFGNGYGDFSPTKEKRHILAHRFSYEIHLGEIPNGMHVCHRCDVRNCVNPAHLFIGTAKDNMLDMIQKGRRTPGPFMYGTTNPACKLSWDKVREMRSLHLKLTYDQLADKFGVSKSLVGEIVRGRIWLETSAR